MTKRVASATTSLRMLLIPTALGTANGCQRIRSFDYVYGILHSPDYRARYANDLARLLPRIPEVKTSEAFRAFSEAGRELLDLHIGYEIRSIRTR